MYKILVADDDALSRNFISEVIRKVLKLEVVQASSVADAVKMTGSGVDMVLVDQHFGDGKVGDYCSAVEKADPALLKIPKWLITGERPLQWDKQYWGKYGVMGYIVKPCKVDEIKVIVRKYLPGINL